MSQVRPENSPTNEQLSRNKLLRWSFASLTFVGICLFVSLILIITLKIVYNADPTAEKNAMMLFSLQSVCKRPVCLKMAEYFKESIDTTIDPCDDFYKFACGGFVKKHPANRNQDLIQRSVNAILSDAYRSKRKSRSRAVQFVKVFREKCVHLKDQGRELGALKKFIVEIGGMPLMDPKTFNSEIPWWKRQAVLLREFSFVYKSYFRNGFLIRLTIHPGGFSLKTPDKLKNFTETSIKLLESIICMLQEKGTCSDEILKRVHAEIQTVMEFKSKISNVAKDAAVRTKKRVTVKDLKLQIPAMPWYEFANEVFQKASVLRSNDNLEFREVDVGYFKRLLAILKETKPSTVANYLGLHLIDSFANFVLKNETYFKITGNDVAKETWCGHVIRYYIYPEVLSRIFVANANLSTDDEDISEIALNIQQGLLNLIGSASWLGNRTKVVLLQKVTDVVLKLGYPRWIGNDVALDELFKVSTDSDRKPFLELLHEAMQFTIDEKFQEVIYPNYQAFKWLLQSFVNNGVTEHTQNSITVPGSKYLPSSYWRNGIKAINYGGIGRTIAHEFGHGVTATGVSVDAYGNVVNKSLVFDTESLAEFQTRIKCTIDQFNSFYDAEANITLNGSVTVSDDLSDMIGLRAAYYGYLLSGPQDERLPGLEDLSDRKLFFISIANHFCSTDDKNRMFGSIQGKHSPNKFRAFLPHVNFDEFSKVFNCPEGSKMNLNKKCVLW